ncbi:ERCC4-type nuclease [Cerasibacillus quisquiliarum]|uniref:Helix-hairpin-helix DNA-binding motif class 1 domain-containing protein n=1 Tax=Cerasibacillus quisquiliarum TaxID=227865 RepID=A0A511UWX8_9BACI|nr:hypothetical protein [Cerasibacillus quisquiliarum]MBB5144849.1 ERCC4-type nuclease [Cerasibacillus quisquiliarum]GEN30258.1 hypothetical protein CQU01_04960 [Cerasibacillus quisquiliarum]
MIHTKRRKKLRNPLLIKRYEEGFKDGIEHAANVIAKNFEGIENIKGIGPKTAEKIREHVFKKTKERSR